MESETAGLTGGICGHRANRFPPACTSLWSKEPRKRVTTALPVR